MIESSQKFRYKALPRIQKLLNTIENAGGGNSMAISTLTEGNYRRELQKMEVPDAIFFRFNNNSE